MTTIEVVECLIVGRRVIVAVPPAPVAAFRDEQLLAGRPQVRRTGSRGLECGARVCKLAPRALIVGVADPDVEVPVDPRPWKDAAQLTRCSRARLAHRH